MRTAALVVALVASLSTIARAAQEGCDTSPRWLAVTVLGYNIVDQDMKATTVENPLLLGGRLLDRCRILEIRSVLRRSDQTELGLIELRQTQEDPERFHLLTVAETPNAICAALPDCVVVSQAGGSRTN